MLGLDTSFPPHSETAQPARCWPSGRTDESRTCLALLVLSQSGKAPQVPVSESAVVKSHALSRPGSSKRPSPALLVPGTGALHASVPASVSA
jgi:hypothetical protein